MKNVVITGGSRGIGRALALEFLKLGSMVWISGRHSETLEDTVRELAVESGNGKIKGIVCDVTRLEEITHLWTSATASQMVDIWINNAGINHMQHNFHELNELHITHVIDTNIRGTILASKVAIDGMLMQGSGIIYNMEGFGSNGRILKGMSIYGTSKNAVRYFTRSLIKEYKNSPINIGSISPGMVITDMLLEPLRKEPENNRNALKVFHLLADTTDRVTPWIVRKILNNSRHGIHITWLTPRKIALRIVKGMFKKRKVKGLPGL